MRRCPVSSLRLLPWAATLTLSLLAGCGDDFQRVETSAADVATDAAQDANVVDAVADAADGGAQGDTDAVGLPAACTVDGDCAAEAGTCQVASCKEGLCLLSPAADGAACDDGEACTSGSVCKGGQCGGGAPDGSLPGCACQSAADCKDDGDRCNGVPYCDVAAGVCKTNPASVVQCPPSALPCQQVSCVTQSQTDGPPIAACVAGAVAEGTPCDDGNACTGADACKAGACQGGANACQCLSDADCAAFEDGDLCTGTLFCDTAAFPYACKVNPATVPSIPADLDPNDCTTIACDPATGLAMAVTRADGSACEDGEPCTKGDNCLAGACTAGANQCPCKSDADCAALDDGNPCNGTLACVVGGENPGCTLIPGSVVTCANADLGPCLALACDPKDGSCKSMAANEGGACQDGDVCTLGDACQGGACKPGTPACTCKADADCAPFEDGDLCNGTLFCDTSAAPFVCKVNPKTVVSCPEGGGACEANVCNPTKGACEVVALPDATTCDADGFGCTVGDACKQGACVAGPNECFCSGDGDCGQHEDGDLCNGTLFCNKSAQPFVCTPNPATIKTCSTADDGPCAVNTCVPSTGACAPVTLPDGATCNADSDACTAGDSCVGGACKAGPTVCGCKSDADCAAFEDGDPCNGTLFCDLTAATPSCVVKPGSVVLCDSSKDAACTKNLCTVNGGCAMQVLADGAPCADDDPCTVGDTCKSGQCTGGGNLCGCLDDDDCLPLDDGDLCNGVPTCVKEGGKGLCKADPSSAVQCGPSPVPCTSHVCQPSTGQCLPQPAPEHDGKPCDDGDACTTGTGCAGGSCTLGQLIACDDGKPCTKDACSATSGCVYAPLDATVSCDDGNACTSADTCDGKGTCIGQPVAACNDNEACTMDACDAAKGCVFAPIDNGAPCNDGDACTIGDACSGGSCKGGQSKVCDDQMPCTLDGCDASTGCTVKPVQSGTPCDDGVVCTEGDACDAEGGCFGTLKNCEDGKPCTLDACKDGTCTHSDIADGGKCDDGNPCVDSACSGTFGCVVTPKANGSSCGGDGAVCDGGSCGACDLGAAIFFEGGFLSSVVVVEGGVTATGVSSNRGWWLGLQDNLDKAWSSVNNAATLSKFIAEHSDAVAHEGGVVQVGNQFLLSNQTTTGVVYGVDAKGTLTFSTALPTNTAAWDISSRGDKSFVVFGYDKNQAVSVTVWFDTAGKIKETSTYGSIGTVEFQSGAFVTGQDYIAGGFQKNKVGTPFWVGRVNHKQGTASWQTAPSGTANGSAADIAVLGSVVYAAGATYSDLGAQYGSLYALGANDGKVAWQALDGSPVAAAIWNGVAADDKGVVVAGSRLVKGGGLAARLVRYDTSGKMVWQHSPKYGTYAQLFDVQLLPDGGGVAVGSGAAGSGSEVGYAVRFGPTGALYCTGAP